jgi:eukaryotic-like serine/threonine-protein kinase
MTQPPKLPSRPARPASRNQDVATIGAGFELVGPASSPRNGSASGSRAVAKAVSSSRVQALIGTTLDGRYTVESVLGEGGMGVVYLGRHTLIDKPVAIKALRSDLVEDVESTARFINEAQSASKIGSDHIIDISDFGMLPGGGAYFVMEYLKGRGLSDLITKHTKLPVARMLRIAKQVAEGLGAAHRAGIVHRDLKPDNVMLIERGGDPDFVKILDFGIAKVGSNAASRLTRAGTVFGTPQYMSPEQAAGLNVDHRADIYSLGIIMYEMLKGEPPFMDPNVMNILSHQMFRSPPPLRDASNGDEIPEPLEAIVRKCLAKKTDARYATMDELVADIRVFEAGSDPSAAIELAKNRNLFSDAPPSFPTGPKTMLTTSRTLPRIAKRKYAAWGLGAGLLIAAVGVAGFAFSSRPSEGVAVVPTADTATTVQVPLAIPARKRVQLKFEPKNATITLEDRLTVVPAVGAGAAVLDVAEGTSLRIVLTAPGHKERSILVPAIDELSIPPLEKEKPAAVASAKKAPVDGVKLLPKPNTCPPERWIESSGTCCRKKKVFNSCQDF